MNHVTHMNESCHTYKGDISHIWMGHGMGSVARTCVAGASEACLTSA